MAEDGSYLFEQLKRYAASDMYPLHMPGHKRRTGWQIDPYSLDITEVEGFDNLHHPEGCLKLSMERAAQLYGADKTYYLVNGSTCGILAAVCAAVPVGGKLVMARNSHKSAYHAVVLNRLKTAMIYPQKVDKLGISGGISAENVDNILFSAPDAAAVLLVSPTYDGVISDIASVAEVVHSHNIPLIVDEAHGAHLKFTSDYRSALECGADVVVQSLHKTLPSLTQTALLHIKGGRVDTEKIERYLQIFQSSSPSYILLGSIEACIKESAAHAPGEWDAHLERMAAFRKSLEGLSAVSVPGREKIRGMGGIYDFDDSRLLISVKDCMMRDEACADPVHRAADGRWLAGILRKRYHLETEMAADTYVCAITTPFDSDEGLARLAEALRETDKELVRIHEPVKRRNPRRMKKLTGPAANTPENVQSDIPTDTLTYVAANVTADTPEPVMSIADALDAVAEPLPARQCAGRTAAEFAAVYPPGIPIMVPGERIDENTLRTLSEWSEKGFRLQGMADETARTIRVVRE